MVLYDPENGEKIGLLQATMHSFPRVILKEVGKCGLLLAAVSYCFEDYMQGVLLIGNPIQTILHMPIGSPLLGYGT